MGGDSTSVIRCHASSGLIIVENLFSTIYLLGVHRDDVREYVAHS